MYTTYPENPCENGHVFIWSASSTGERNPPDGWPCECGHQLYKNPRLATDGEAPKFQEYPFEYFGLTWPVSGASP